MATLQQRQLLQDIAANGKVESNELESLRREFLADGKVGREEADLLVELYKRIERRSPAFQDFVFRAVKMHVLAGGRINADATAWLRQMVLHDGALRDEERKLLNELKGEAREMSPEFEAFFAECMKMSPPARTSGGKR
jgi:hypothetical protein